MANFYPPGSFYLFVTQLQSWFLFHISLLFTLLGISHLLVTKFCDYVVVFILIMFDANFYFEMSVVEAGHLPAQPSLDS